MKEICKGNKELNENIIKKFEMESETKIVLEKLLKEKEEEIVVLDEKIEKVKINLESYDKNKIDTILNLIAVYFEVSLTFVIFTVFFKYGLNFIFNYKINESIIQNMIKIFIGCNVIIDTMLLKISLSEIKDMKEILNENNYSKKTITELKEEKEKIKKQILELKNNINIVNNQINKTNNSLMKRKIVCLNNNEYEEKEEKPKQKSLKKNNNML